MSLTPVSLDVAISKFVQKNCYKQFENYKEIYLGFNNLIKNYSGLMKGIGKKLLKGLAEDELIKYKIKNDKRAYSLYSIAKYKFELKMMEDHYLEISEALLKMGLKKNITSRAHLHRFIYLHENDYLKLTILNRQINNKKRYFVERNELDNFLQKHISINEAANIFNLELSTLRQYWFQKYKHYIIYFHHDDPDLCFVNKEAWLEFAKEKSKHKLLTREKASKKLKITSDNFNKVVEEYNICPEKFKFNIESASFFNESDVNKLIHIQSGLLKDYRHNYYTTHKAADFLGIKTDYFYKYGKKIKATLPPPIIQTNYEGLHLRKSGILKLYLKSDVENLKKELNDKKEFDDILYKLQDTSVNILFKLLEQQYVMFHENGCTTQDYWFKYVTVKLNKSHASDRTMRKDILILFSTTKRLVELTNQKEIFNYTTKEILLSVFNSPISKAVKLEFYKFLKKLEESRKSLNKTIHYNTNKLPNPYKENSKSNIDKTIYSIPEFLDLCDFVSNIELHKEKAINDVIKQLHQSNTNLQSKKSYQYGSVWLYSLLHMNNAWRHADIISFPRLKLTNSRLEDFSPIEALDWLKQNSLNKEEIQSIVNQAKALPLYHSKTKKKRYFFCSQNLESAFAHAVAICELRIRIFNPLYTSLIDLDNRSQVLKATQEKLFFKSFNREFTFKSKQMNRTLISLIYSVIKKMTNRNPLEITKYIRSHSDIETTNIYLDIPQEHMNFISKQLFDLGPFGYAFETLTQLVIGDLPTDREERTALSLKIKDTFGDVYQVENLARYLNRLSKEHISLKKALLDMSDNERKNLFSSIKLGQQPAKYEGYQCIYRTCEYPSRECNKCPFAIHHFYSLSEVSDTLVKFIKEYQLKFDKSSKQGEKIHLANILYSYLDVVKQAIIKFGKENVSLFFDNGLDGLKEELSKIESSINIVTVRKG